MRHGSMSFAAAPRRARAEPQGRRAARGLGWVLLLLAAFSVVPWRQSRGIALERELRAVEAELAVVETERVALTQEIHELASRARILRVARERFGMALPADSQLVLLPVPAELDARSGAEAEP